MANRSSPPVPSCATGLCLAPSRFQVISLPARSQLARRAAPATWHDRLKGHNLTTLQMNYNSIDANLLPPPVLPRHFPGLLLDHPTPCEQQCNLRCRRVRGRPRTLSFDSRCISGAERRSRTSQKHTHGEREYYTRRFARDHRAASSERSAHVRRDSACRCGGARFI